MREFNFFRDENYFKENAGKTNVRIFQVNFLLSGR